MATSSNRRRAPLTRKGIYKRAALVLVLFVASASISYPQGANWFITQFNTLTHANAKTLNFPIVLGLDLQGGTHLEYSADLSAVEANERAGAMEGVKDVIERRVNSMGVSEPLILTTRDGDSWRLTVELAGVRDINEAIKMIGETPILEFREENPDAGRTLTAEEQAKIDTENASRLQVITDAVGRIEKGEAIDAVARSLKTDHSQISDVTDLGWVTPTSVHSVLLQAFEGKDPGYIVPQPVDSGENLYAAKLLEKRSVGQEIRVSHILIQWEGASNSVSTSTKENAKTLAESIRAQVNPTNFADLVKQYSEEPGTETSLGDLGWFRQGAMVPEFENAAFTLQKGEISAVVESAFGYHIIFKTDEREAFDEKVSAVVLKKMTSADVVDSEPYKRTELTGTQLDRATLDFDQNTGTPQVTLKFDAEGTKLFADITKRNIGKPVAIYLDGSPISIPTVQNEIPSGEAVISGSFTVAEAKLLAQRLQSGALPVPIEIIAQQSVGPILGAQSIADSLEAGLIGFLLVIIFMVLMYRLPGLISAVSLACYVAIVFACFRLIPVTLSLSGIAGFILSLGIAVDANVLVFERLKEEYAHGRPMGITIDEAFRRAWSSIWDGNITTLIVCITLYLFTSSLIRGFALTLGIGIIASMFSAGVITQIFLKLIATEKTVNALPWVFLKKTGKGGKE